MKKLIAVVAILLSVNALMAQTQNHKRFADKSGEIDYEWTGKMKGTEVMYWDEWGYKEYHIAKTEMKILGMKQVNNQHTLRIGDMVYTWKDGETKGTKMKDENYAAMAESVKDWEEFGKGVMTQLGYEKKGSDLVGGKNCERWEGVLGKIWIYKSYGLKSEVNMLGITSTMMFTDYKAGSSVNASVFNLPKNVTFELIDPNNMPEGNDQPEGDEDDEEQQVPNAKQARKALKSLLEGM